MGLKQSKETEDGPTDMATLLILFANCYKKLKLPGSLIKEIFDFAGLHASSSSCSTRHLRGHSNQNEIYLSHKLPGGNLYFEPVLFLYEVTSKDQGWSSYSEHHGTYNGAYSWGEANLLISDTGLSAEFFEAASSSSTKRHEVYRNLHAHKEWQDHVKEFGEDSKLLQTYKDVKRLLHSSLVGETVPSDIYLQLWLRSLYPGWLNQVKEARMTVIWKLVHWEEFVIAKRAVLNRGT